MANTLQKEMSRDRKGRANKMIVMIAAFAFMASCQATGDCWGQSYRYPSTGYPVLHDNEFERALRYDANTAGYVDFQADKFFQVRRTSVVEAVLFDPPTPDEPFSNNQPPAASEPPRPIISDPLPETGSGEIERADTLGTAPDNSYQLQYLRRQTPLLSPGQWQFDFGITYSITESDLPVPVVNGGNVVNVVEGRLRQRLLLAPLELRYGLFEGVQLFANVPLGWSNTEFSIPGFDSFSDNIGIGDVNAGATVLLREGYCNKPYIVGTLACTAPTGNASFPLLTSFTPDSQLGEGFWALSASLLFIHTYDPVSVFYGGGYRHRFEDDFLTPAGRVTVDPGEQVFYQFGVGFAANDRVTFSTRFIGAYFSENVVNGDRIEGTIFEPMRLRFAVTIQNCATIVEPFAEVGMTDDGPSARAGITWTY